jgi:hypothetical protein
LIAELRNVGTFDPAAFNEVRQNGAAPLGSDGFATPSLLSLFAFPQTFFHNGSASPLDAVIQKVAHRSAGTGTDTLQDAAKRQQLVKFLLSIDAATQPVAPAAPSSLTVTCAGADIGPSVAPDSLASGSDPVLMTHTSTVQLLKPSRTLRPRAVSFSAV